MGNQTEPTLTQSLTFSPAIPAASTPAPAAGAAPEPATAGTNVFDALKSSGEQQAIVPAGAAVTLPLPTAIPVAWLAAPAVPALDAPLAVINNRRVRLAPAGSGEPPSLYRLCRQWVQNDPDLGDPVPEPVPKSKLPPLPPLSTEAEATLQQPTPQEPPLPTTVAAAAGDASSREGGSERPVVDTLMQHHKQHWAAVRRHQLARAVAAQQRYVQRLQAVLTLSNDPATAAAGAPVLVQQ